jgi:diguanylate cyclase (GGDEF)-like protein/PAS domain S-box-containing protein
MAMAIVVGLAMFVPAAIVSGVLFARSQGAIREEIRGNLRRLAKAASALVDPELHKTFADPSQESSPEYEQAVAPLRKFVNLDVTILYVYTCVLRDGEVRFVLDPTEAGDHDRDGVDDKSHIMQPYDDPSDEMLNAIKHQASSADSEPYSDDWGTFISGYAPIFDEEGEFVAIVGVDLTADRYSARLAGVRAALFLAVTVALVVSLCGAVAAFYFQRRRHEWAEEQNTASRNLQVLADSLDSANSQLRFASRRFEQLFNLIPVACFTTDCDGRLFEFNREAQRLTSRSPESVVQKSVFETLVSERNQQMFHKVLAAIRKGLPTIDVEWSDEDARGGNFTVVLSAFPLQSAKGEVTGGIIACADITMRQVLQRQIERQISELQSAYKGLDDSQSHLQEANERLSRLAAIDSLTGINNRRTIFESLEKTISSTNRTGRPASILMIDIDHFKAFNDKHGHLLGDVVLKFVAGLIQSGSRMHDEAGRYGGEEFLVVLPETDESEAMLVAERIRESVERHDCQGHRVTVSIGVSTFKAGVPTSEQFIAAADRALYEAKRGGRNRVVHSRTLKDEGAA